ncbi:hypothetical protein DERF_012503 [Dermatophagoides farinae]|uniref:Uncharacterized protein n=1 Tax=Dermatophagoides farinae TaxID=6954 RepID=A0A922HSP6_DERFA|nr:hypothetical protein DERF_012503 [Dermatophagoides farinae]
MSKIQKVMKTLQLSICTTFKEAAILRSEWIECLTENKCVQSSKANSSTRKYINIPIENHQKIIWLTGTTEIKIILGENSELDSGVTELKIYRKVRYQIISRIGKDMNQFENYFKNLIDKLIRIVKFNPWPYTEFMREILPIFQKNIFDANSYIFPLFFIQQMSSIKSKNLIQITINSNVFPLTLNKKIFCSYCIII